MYFFQDGHRENYTLVERFQHSNKSASARAHLILLEFRRKENEFNI